MGLEGAQPDSRGIITGVRAGREVRVAFFGLPALWRGDPADVEIEQMFEVGEWVRLKEGVVNGSLSFQVALVLYKV